MLIKEFAEQDRERDISEAWSRRMAVADPEVFKSYVRRLKHKPKDDE